MGIHWIIHPFVVSFIRTKSRIHPARVQYMRQYVRMYVCTYFCGYYCMYVYTYLRVLPGKGKTKNWERSRLAPRVARQFSAAGVGIALPNPGQTGSSLEAEREEREILEISVSVCEGGPWSKFRFLEAQVCFVQDFVLSLLVVNLLSLGRCWSPKKM
jgi:hypothetical protein